MRQFTIILTVLLALVFLTENNFADPGCNLSGFATYTQGGWGSPSGSTPGTIRDTYFSSVFPSGMTMGGTYTASFSSASIMAAFLPQGKTTAAFNRNYINPTETSAGVFGGQLAALILNVKYSEAGHLGTNSGKLGELVFVSGPLAGVTVNQLLTYANTAIGGGSTPYSLTQLETAADNVNNNFDNGTQDLGYLRCATQAEGSVGNLIWNDDNKNGIQDAGEIGILNVTVGLYNCSGSLVSTTTTDANGIYNFSNLAAGSYYIQVTAPSGYTITSANSGSNDNVDSDVSPSTGTSSCFTLAAGATDNSHDAGLYMKEADLKVEKSVSDNVLSCDKNLTYTVKLTNNGPSTATGVKISDVLPSGLIFNSSSATSGSYDNTTGLWTVGSLSNGSSATLQIHVTVDCSSLTSSSIDLGPAKDFNLFVLHDFTAPSADVQGRVAVGHDANLSGYSVADQLPPSDSTLDVLIVGHDLIFTVGDVFAGNAVFGNNSNLPVSSVGMLCGTVRQESVIDFKKAKDYLEGLSTTLSGYTSTGSVSLQFGGLNLVSSNPYLNVFTVNAEDINACNSVQIEAPNASVVVVNIMGDNINWHGGLTVSGTVMNNVLYNFPEAKNIKISGIDLTGSVLAPFAEIDYPAGVQHGQMICKSIHGSGQFNLAPFKGNVPTNKSIVNVASVSATDLVDPVSSNNSASVTCSFASDTSMANTGKWDVVAELPEHKVISCITSDNNGHAYAGTEDGSIYQSSSDLKSWKRVNEEMYSGQVRCLKFNKDGGIYAATVSGVYKSSGDYSKWSKCGLDGDVRDLKTDSDGKIYAGVWSKGVFKSDDHGETWKDCSSGLKNTQINSVTISIDHKLYAGTFGSGLLESSDDGDSWKSVCEGHNFVWTCASNSKGYLYAGTYGEGLYCSKDKGETWSKTKMPATFVYSLGVDASDNIFASSYSGGVYASSDDGDNWTCLGMNGVGISSMHVSGDGQGDGEHHDDKAVFSGTAGGRVYRSVTNLTAVKDSKIIPTEFKVEQNYPNPFNPNTVIGFSLPKQQHVSITVYNALGQVVRTLADRSYEAGHYSVTFNASELASGVYIYRLQAGAQAVTKKMILQK